MAERYKSTVETVESKISSLSRLNDLKKDGAVSDEEFERLKSELLRSSPAEQKEPVPDLDGFSKDLFNMDTDTYSEPSVPAAEEGLTDVVNGMDISLDNEDRPITENVTDGINFDLHSEGIIPDKTSQPKNAAKRLEEIERLFMGHLGDYTARDCALMDCKTLSSLSSIPLFLVGAAAAVFFFYIMKSFADMAGTLAEFLIILCICAGIAPACVIIPNTIKLSRRSKAAKEANSILTENFMRSGVTDIPFEYTSPYVLSALEDIIDSGKADSIPDAVDCLNSELSDSEELAAEKKRADFAENDELAARSAALYVLGKGLLNDM